MTVPTPVRTISAETWRLRRGERGQIMPLLALTIVTMGLMALVAITFGQAVVRRQQAQMVVDAAAFAGAAEQAKGLNTLARINEKQYNILNAVIAAQGTGLATGYHDSAATTRSRLSLLCWLPCTGPDWSSRNWFDYVRVFETLNQSADAVNSSYGAAFKPHLAARKVVNENFGEPGAIFQNEEPIAHGPVVHFSELDRTIRLVDCTTPQPYAVGNGRNYTPHYPTMVSVCRQRCRFLIIPKLVAACTASCVQASLAKYTSINLYLNTFELWRTGAPRYRAGHFYDNEPGQDVRFSYFLKIAGSRPLVGKSWLPDVPDMVVMATAKPYAGHMGDYFDERLPWLGTDFARFGYTQDAARTISSTYKAWLIPVRTLEKRQAALLGGIDVVDPEVYGRYLSVMH